MVTGVRRVVLWFMSTLTALVLLFGYQTSTSGPAVTAEESVVASTAEAGADASVADGTVVTGPAVDTRWGPVQVQVTVSGGRLTDVEVVEYPTGNGKDRQINAYAVPRLVQETLDAQGADIDMVSGATVTSEGYVESLQAALDEAGL
ncbi:FMN-binding protein [Geodermatophilus sp. SYSU D00965]